jgi:hypothetical protein
MSARIGAPHHPMGAPSKVFLIEETKSPPTIVIPAFAGAPSLQLAETCHLKLFRKQRKVVLRLKLDIRRSG